MQRASGRLGSARVQRVGFGVSPKRTCMRISCCLKCSLRKVREIGTISPTRETRALPNHSRNHAAYLNWQSIESASPQFLCAYDRPL
jgi:hypothetical protein